MAPAADAVPEQYPHPGAEKTVIHVPPGTSAAPTPSPDSLGMSLVPVASPSTQPGASCSSEIAPDMEHRITGRWPGAVTMEKSPLLSQSVIIGLCVDPCRPPACDPHGPAGPLQPIAQ